MKFPYVKIPTRDPRKNLKILTQRIKSSNDITFIPKGGVEKDIEVFEDKVQHALEIWFKDISVAGTFNKPDIRKFYHLYLESSYRKESIEKLVYYLFDLKLQTLFVLKDSGVYNRSIVADGLEHSKNLENDIVRNPYFLLKYLSLDQSMILKNRILWERIMNFVYYLETSEILERKRSGNRSKGKIFWEFVEENRKWIFLLKYKDYISQFDDFLRGPETHKASKLRRYFLEDKLIDSSIILSIGNLVQNMWQNIFYVIEGKEMRVQVWDIAFEKINELARKPPQNS